MFIRILRLRTSSDVSGRLQTSSGIFGNDRVVFKNPSTPRIKISHLYLRKSWQVYCMMNENCCSEDGGRGIKFCPLFWSPLWGIWQLKCPSLQEFAIHGKTMDLTDALCRRSAISSSQHGQNFLPFLRSYSTTTSKLSLDLGEVSLFYNSLFY